LQTYYVEYYSRYLEEYGTPSACGDGSVASEIQNGGGVLLNDDLMSNGTANTTFCSIM
jgi:hypothetical protein